MVLWNAFFGKFVDTNEDTGEKKICPWPSNQDFKRAEQYQLEKQVVREANSLACQGWGRGGTFNRILFSIANQRGHMWNPLQC